MKRSPLFISFLLMTSALGGEFSKELRLDNPQYIAHNASNPTDRVDGYTRWLFESTNFEQDQILSQLKDLSYKEGYLKEVMAALCEQYLEHPALSNLPKLQTTISDMLPRYINTYIDKNYTHKNENFTPKGIMVSYRNLVELLLPHSPLIASAILKQGYLCLSSMYAHADQLLYDINDKGMYVKDIYVKYSTIPEVAAIIVENLSWTMLNKRQHDKLLSALNTASCLDRIGVDSNNFYLRAIIHTYKGDYAQALTYARTAYSFDSSSLLRKYLATTLSYNEQFDEAISHYKAVLKQGDFNDGLLERELLQALQLAGKDAEATELLLNEFSHIRKNMKKHQEHKTSMTNHVKEVPLKISQKKNSQRKTITKPKNNDIIKFDSDEPISIDYSPSSSKSLKGEYRIKEKEQKDKIKTKGTPNLHVQEKQEVKQSRHIDVQPMPQTTTLTAEELLGENSHHYDTFCNFYRIQMHLFIGNSSC